MPIEVGTVASFLLKYEEVRIIEMTAKTVFKAAWIAWPLGNWAALRCWRKIPIALIDRALGVEPAYKSESAFTASRFHLSPKPARSGTRAKPSWICSGSSRIASAQSTYSR